MAQADISGRSLIYAQFVHAQTSVDDRSPLFPVAFPTFIFIKLSLFLQGAANVSRVKYTQVRADIYEMVVSARNMHRCDHAEIAMTPATSLFATVTATEEI
jgi:hypothetical protein